MENNRTFLIVILAIFVIGIASSAYAGGVLFNPKKLHFGNNQTFSSTIKGIQNDARNGDPFSNFVIFLLINVVAGLAIGSVIEPPKRGEMMLLGAGFALVLTIAGVLVTDPQMQTVLTIFKWGLVFVAILALAKKAGVLDTLLEYLKNWKVVLTLAAIGYFVYSLSKHNWDIGATISDIFINGIATTLKAAWRIITS